MTETTSIPLCFCGCGKQTKQARNGRFNKFVLGHNVKTNQTSINGHSGQFKPGNTMGKGRPNGSKNSATIAAENLIQGEGEALSRKLIDLALDGNVSCLKTAIERLVPPCKSRSVNLPDMPMIESIADAAKLTSYVLTVVAEGKISPVEGEIISRSAERHLKALEVRDLELRLANLEQRLLDKQN
jgi:hypothetical protein